MPKRRFGLIGKNISYSFSKKYFTEKFSKEGITDCSYENFDIPAVEMFPEILTNNPEIAGFNVTIPYKETIIPFLETLSKNAKQIGAVNVIKAIPNGQLKGYNSDWYGFKKSLQKHLSPEHKNALILGTGGAAKGVAFGLTKLGIPYLFVSRNPNTQSITYDAINKTTFEEYQIIINCTPLGTFPNIDEKPPIPYHFFTKNHIAMDLIYNPEETNFLKSAKEQGATTINGKEMLEFQAEKAWEIWNK